MALTLEGSALTEAHRVAQVTVQAEAVKDLAAVWPLLDPRDLDGSFEAYARAAMAVLDLRREQSATLASGYYEAFREVEGVTKPLVDLPTFARLAEEQALTSLFVTGPIEAKKTMARESARSFEAVTLRNAEEKPLSARTATAMERAFVTSAGAAMRLTADAGRDVIARAIYRDDVAVGYARVTDGAPCAFCAMLASRGITYKRGSFADSDPRFTGKGSAKVHDHCGCTSEPVFKTGPDYNLPGRAQEFADLWERTGKHYTGDDAVNAFRRAYERPQLHLP